MTERAVEARLSRTGDLTRIRILLRLMMTAWRVW